MTKPVKRWIAVSRKAPCPVCGKPDNCKLSHDGSAVWCGRVSNGAARQNAGGQWLHRLNGHDEASQATDWEDETRALALQAGMQRRELADALGVCPESLKALGIGWNGKDQCWTFPERDADGTVIGLSRRFSDGSKKQAPGSKRGLCYVDGWQETGGPVLIVEGGSDTAAGITLGLPTIGRPSNRGGADHLVKLLANQPADREIIVLGERDEKLDGQWPGRDGAVSVAGRLAAGLGRSVGWALPPARAKDLRAWLQANGPDAEALLAALDVQAVEPSAAVQPGRAPVLVRMSDVDPRPLNWLWPNRIPAGRLTLLVGMPGAGKSFLTCDMAARVSTGSRWADGSDCRRGSVILVSAEDDPHDTIRPRLDAAGADVGRIHLLNAVKQTTDDGKQTEWMFTLSDVDMLDSALQRVSDCRLVVVDPIGSFLGGGTDAHRDNEVRAVLAPVAQLAEKHGVAVLVVAHRRKSTASVADDLALGSRAFTGIARSVWHLSCDTNDRERRLLLPGKCNLAPQQCGLSFFIAGEPGSLVWEADPVETTADDGLRLENAERPGPDPEAATEAVEFLNRALSDGPRPSKDVKEEARVVLATAADRLGAHRQPHLE